LFVVAAEFRAFLAAVFSPAAGGTGHIGRRAVSRAAPPAVRAARTRIVSGRKPGRLPAAGRSVGA
jgi:hypothetical protein